MSTEIKAPQFPESVADGTVATWHKAVGEAVSRDELLVDIETDKVVLEVVAPADGVLTAIHKDVGETVLSEELLGIFEAGAAASTPAPVAAEPAAEAPAEAPAGPGGAASPAARKAASELGVELAQVRGSGRDGRITKEDVEKAAAAPASAPAQ
ncbi:MAG: E3 binding domain-containing protein, partial [Pseudomonadales bacterium]